MGDLTDDEKLFFYGDENGRGAWWDSPWLPGDDDEDDERDAVETVATCYNCDAPLTLQQAMEGKLFCSEKCQQTAETVRYARRTLRDGRYQRDPLVRQAIHTRITLILGGGYPKKARALTDAQREAIFLRDGGRCRLCGAPATDIDHIKGSSPDPQNLQALCKPCNMAKAEANFRPATPEEAMVGKAIWHRIKVEQPSRLCDDEQKWNKVWRELASKQRKSASF